MLPGCSFLALLLLVSPVARTDAPKQAPTSVPAVVETTLKTASDHIRQFAFDGDAETYFASEQNATTADHFTLVFARPVALQSVTVITGRPNGEDMLDAGSLEVSTDGKQFRSLLTITPAAKGEMSLQGGGKAVKAVRIKPTEDLKHPLAIREVRIQSEPAVQVFRYPVEFVLDTKDAPEMREWLEKAAHVCEEQYPMICEELKSEGWKPRNVVTMTLKSDYNGVAATGGSHITGSVKYFKDHPDDIGAMVHETVHVVQNYRGRNNPGWLVEGVADYIRFFKYEPPDRIGRLNVNRARYNGSYRVTARFLAYVTDKYDKELVRKLNAAMRQGKYQETIWKDLTGKTVQELDEGWREALER